MATPTKTADQLDEVAELLPTDRVLVQRGDGPLQTFTGQSLTEATAERASELVGAAVMSEIELVADNVIDQIRMAARNGFYPSTAAAQSMGVAGVEVTAGGAGGAAGVYPIVFTGGGTGSSAAGYYVVAGGAVTSVVVEKRGWLYTANPDLDVSASGVAGATFVVARSQNEPPGSTYLVQGDGVTAFATLWQNVAGVATALSVQIDKALLDLVLDTSRQTNMRWAAYDPTGNLFLGVDKEQDDVLFRFAGSSARIAAWEENARMAGMAGQRHDIRLLFDGVSHLVIDFSGQSEVTGAAAPRLITTQLRPDDCFSFGPVPNPADMYDSHYDLPAGYAAGFYPLISQSAAEHPAVLCCFQLAAALNDGLSSLGKTIVAVTTAVPSTSLEERAKSAEAIDDDGNLYRKTTEAYRQVKDVLDDIGGTARGKVAVILNWDGPSNYGRDKYGADLEFTSSADYGDCLTLWDQYRHDKSADARARFGVDEDPLWLQVLCGHYWTDGADDLMSVSRAGLDWALACRRRGLPVFAVGPMSHMPKKADGGPHPQAISAMWAGALFERQLIDILRGGDVHAPYVAKTWVRKNRIYLAVRSETPLVERDYHFICNAVNTPNKGFAVTDAYGTALRTSNPEVLSVEQVGSHVLCVTTDRDPDPETYRVWIGPYLPPGGYYGSCNFFEGDTRVASQAIPEVDPAYFYTGNLEFPEANIPALVGIRPPLGAPLAPYVTGGATGGDWDMDSHITALVEDLTWQAS